MSDGDARARTPSIRDVAASAGVSYQTVSRVLNEHPSIRPETKQRVLDAMSALDYRPNLAARALVTSRSRTLGVVLGERAEYGPSLSLSALEDAARANGYWVNAVHVSDTRQETIRDAVEHLRLQSVEGIVVHAPQVRVFDTIESMSFDVPIIGLHTADRGVVELAHDQVEAARIATEHLISLGHSDIVHLAGPQDWIEAESRMQGYLQAIADAELPTLPPLLGDWSADLGYRAGLELSRRLDFTAVFCANDAMAIGLMHGFREAGIDVPRRVSVVGFDDVPVAAHTWPPLTTVHQNFAGLGTRAVRAMLALIEGSPAAASGEPVIDVRPELVVRGSTGPALTRGAQLAR